MKKEIIINEANEAAINQLLAEIQKGCRVRTIDLVDITEKCDEIYSTMGIAKASLNGCSFTFDLNGQKVANSYNGTPMSTIVTVTYRNNAWRLADIYRGFTRSNDKAVSFLTDNAKAALLKKYERI